MALDGINELDVSVYTTIRHQTVLSEPDESDYTAEGFLGCWLRQMSLSTLDTILSEPDESDGVTIKMSVMLTESDESGYTTVGIGVVVGLCRWVW